MNNYRVFVLLVLSVVSCSAALTPEANVKGPTYGFQAGTDNVAGVGLTNVTVPYVALGVRPAFALGTQGDTQTDEVFYKTTQPTWQMTPSQGGYYGQKFHRSGNGSLGQLPYRFEGIQSTHLDLGDLNSEDLERTVSFSLRANISTKGFVYAILHHWTNTSSAAVELPLLDALEDVLDGTSTLQALKDSGYLDLGYNVFSAVYLDGATSTMSMVSLGLPSDPKPNSDIDDILRRSTWPNTEIFDGNWHLVAVTLAPSGGDYHVQLFVDGATSYNDRKFRQCRTTNLFDEYAEPASSYGVVSSTGTERVVTGGVAVVGHISSASIFNLQLHGVVLEQTKIINTLGTPWMRDSVSISAVAGIIISAVLLLVGVWTLVDFIMQLLGEISGKSAKELEEEKKKQEAEENDHEWEKSARREHVEEQVMIEDVDNDALVVDDPAADEKSSRRGSARSQEGNIQAEQDNSTKPATPGAEDPDQPVVAVGEEGEAKGEAKEENEEEAKEAKEEEAKEESDDEEEEEEEEGAEKQQHDKKGKLGKAMNNTDATKKGAAAAGKAAGGAQQGTHAYSAAGSAGDSAGAGAESGLQVAEKLLVTVPAFFDVFQGLSLFMRGWEWPYTFTLTVSFIAIPFSFDLTFAGFSIPPYVTIVIVFLVGCGGIGVLLYFAKRDKKIFANTVLQYKDSVLGFHSLVMVSFKDQWAKLKLPDVCSEDDFEAAADYIVRSRRRVWPASSVFQIFPKLTNGHVTPDQVKMLAVSIPAPPENAIHAAVLEFGIRKRVHWDRPLDFSRALCNCQPGESVVDMARVHAGTKISFDKGRDFVTFLNQTFLVLEVSTETAAEDEDGRPVKPYKLGEELIKIMNAAAGGSSLPAPDTTDVPDPKLEIYLHPVDVAPATGVNLPTIDKEKSDVWERADAWADKSGREKQLKKNLASSKGYFTVRHRNSDLRKQRRELRHALNHQVLHGSTWDLPTLTLCSTPILEEAVKKHLATEKKAEEATKQEKAEAKKETAENEGDAQTAEEATAVKVHVSDSPNVVVPDEDMYTLLDSTIIVCRRHKVEGTIVPISKAEQEEEEDDEDGDYDSDYDEPVQQYDEYDGGVLREGEDEIDRMGRKQEEAHKRNLARLEKNAKAAEAKKKENAQWERVCVLSGNLGVKKDYDEYSATQVAKMELKLEQLAKVTEEAMKEYSDSSDDSDDSEGGYSGSSEEDAPKEEDEPEDDEPSSANFSKGDRTLTEDMSGTTRKKHKHAQADANAESARARRALGYPVTFLLTMTPQSLMRCPRHGTHMIPASENRHYQVRNVDGAVPYVCALTPSHFFKEQHHLHACSAGELYVCSCDTCAYTLCKSCAAKFGAKAKVGAILAGKAYDAKRDPAGVISLLSFLALQFVYLPAVQNALMVIACHPLFHCTFGVCYKAPTVDFILAATFSALIALGLGLGLPLFWLIELNGRRKEISKYVNSPMEWAYFLELDKSVMSNLYRKYEQTYMLFEPILLVTGKASIVLVVAFTEANTLLQYAALSFFQAANAILLIVTDPLTDPWADVAIKVGQTHQLFQLGWTGIHRALLVETPSTQVMAIPMMITLFLFIIAFGGIMWFSIIKPWKTAKQMSQAVAIERREFIAVNLPRSSRIRTLNALLAEKDKLYGTEEVHWQQLITRTLLLMAQYPDLETNKGLRKVFVKESLDLRAQLNFHQAGSIPVDSKDMLNFNMARLSDAPPAVRTALGALVCGDLTPRTKNVREHDEKFIDIRSALSRVAEARDESLAIASANALTLAVAAGYSFNYADFSGCFFEGADLCDGHFSNCNFDNADLKGVKALKASFEKCSFRGASTAGARFCVQPVEPAVPLLQFTRNSKLDAEHREEIQRMQQGEMDSDMGDVWEEDDVSEDPEAEEKDLADVGAGLDDPQKLYYGVGVSRNGLVVGCNAKGAAIWSLKDSKHHATLYSPALGAMLVGCALSPDGRSCAVIGGDPEGQGGLNVVVFDVNSRKPLWHAKPQMADDSEMSFLLPVRFSPNNAMLALPDRIFDCSTGALLIGPKKLRTHKKVRKPYTQMAWLSDGKHIIFGSGRIFDMYKLNADGSEVEFERNVLQYKAAQKTEEQIADGEGGSEITVMAMDVSPDSRLMIVSFEDIGWLLLYDLAQGRERFKLQGHHSHCFCLKFAPDGRHVASGSIDKTFLWDPRTGTQTGVIEQIAVGLQWSTDSKRLVICGSAVLLWNSDGGRAQQSTSTTKVQSAAISHDENTFVTAGDDIHVWNLNSMMHQERVVPRLLTAAGHHSVKIAYGFERNYLALVARDGFEIHTFEEKPLALFDRQENKLSFIPAQVACDHQNESNVFLGWNGDMYCVLNDEDVPHVYLRPPFLKPTRTAAELKEENVISATLKFKPPSIRPHYRKAVSVVQNSKVQKAFCKGCVIPQDYAAPRFIFSTGRHIWCVDIAEGVQEVIEAFYQNREGVTYDDPNDEPKQEPQTAVRLLHHWSKKAFLGLGDQLRECLKGRSGQSVDASVDPWAREFASDSGGGYYCAMIMLSDSYYCIEIFSLPDDGEECDSSGSDEERQEGKDDEEDDPDAESKEEQSGDHEENATIEEDDSDDEKQSDAGKSDKESDEERESRDSDAEDEEVRSDGPPPGDDEGSDPHRPPQGEDSAEEGSGGGASVEEKNPLEQQQAPVETKREKKNKGGKKQGGKNKATKKRKEPPLPKSKQELRARYVIPYTVKEGKNMGEWFLLPERARKLKDFLEQHSMHSFGRLTMSPTGMYVAWVDSPQHGHGEPHRLFISLIEVPEYGEAPTPPIIYPLPRTVEKIQHLMFHDVDDGESYSELMVTVPNGVFTLDVRLILEFGRTENDDKKEGEPSVDVEMDGVTFSLSDTTGEDRQLTSNVEKKPLFLDAETRQWKDQEWYDKHRYLRLKAQMEQLEAKGKRREEMPTEDRIWMQHHEQRARENDEDDEEEKYDSEIASQEEKDTPGRSEVQERIGDDQLTMIVAKRDGRFYKDCLQLPPYAQRKSTTRPKFFTECQVDSLAQAKDLASQ